MKLLRKLLVGAASLTCVSMVFGFCLLAPRATYAQSAPATLSVSPTSGTPCVGTSYSVDIILNTGGREVDATDAVLNYDSTKLSVQSITEGTIFNDYPTKTFGSGTIVLSGLASTSSPYEGTGTMGTISFMPIAEGTATVTFVTSGATASSVAEHDTGSDILGSVTNGSFTVATGDSCPSGSGTGSGSETTSSGSELPSTGVLDIGIVSVAVVSVIFGATVTWFRRSEELLNRLYAVNLKRDIVSPLVRLVVKPPFDARMVGKAEKTRGGDK